MVLGIALESQNNFEIASRPKIVHSLHSSAKKTGGRVVYQSSNAEDKDIKDGGMVKRNSMYRGSGEIRRADVRGGGKNFEPYFNDGAFPSFELIDSTPWCTSPSFDNIHSLPMSNMEFLDLSFRDLPEERSKISISYSDVAPAGSSSVGSMLGTCFEKNEINNILGKAVPEFSEQVGISNFYHKEREIMKSSREMLKSGHRTHFDPFKKIPNLVSKSKSPHSTSLTEPGTTNSEPDTESSSKYKVFPRSLLKDLSNVAQKIDNGRAIDRVIDTATSPVHLHAVLKWEFNHGDQSYEFSVKDPEDFLCAKTWKTENAFNWVYTFHCCKMTSNIINPGKKNWRLRPSLMIGQMQVSRYLCSEATEAGSFDNSVVTEFTLYDIAQARKSIATERSQFSSDSNHYSSEFDSDPSTSYPWASAELQSNLEIAAIVTQIPLSMKEALENMQARDQTRVAIGGHSSSPYVKVVIPSGRHGIPNGEELGPSSLLDRWRFGGGCDCGGWDMGCPIVVFDNADNDNLNLRVGTQQPTVLFVKGKKEKVPALTITAIRKGQYAVDFHAQLSALQAFSICISIFHSSEASSAIGQDCNTHNLCPNSLELILEDEMRHIIEAAAESEERKEKRKFEQSPPSFFLDPPFSPMGRV